MRMFLRRKKPSVNKNIEPHQCILLFVIKNVAHCFNEEISEIGIQTDSEGCTIKTKNRYLGIYF